MTQRLPAGPLLDLLAVRADEEVVEVHPGDDLVQPVDRGVAQLRLGTGAIERDDESEARLEEPLGQRLLQ